MDTGQQLPVVLCPLLFSNDFHTSFLGGCHYSWDMPPGTSSNMPLLQTIYGYGSGSSSIFIGGGGGSISGTVTSLQIALLIIGVYLIICTWLTGTKPFCPTCWVGRITDGISIWPLVTLHLSYHLHLVDWYQAIPFHMLGG